jgi:hypothetical protein
MLWGCWSVDADLRIAESINNALVCCVLSFSDNGTLSVMDDTDFSIKGREMAEWFLRMILKRSMMPASCVGIGTCRNMDIGYVLGRWQVVGDCF